MVDKILRSEPLTRPWAGTDPFLFCAYHQDRYPASNGNQAIPANQLRGRAIGNDFSGLDGFSMYHGTEVPGFPAHPHRGFETVTIVARGLVDHADSLGASARYGDGDVQWLTAGRGVMHAEMFPLRSSDNDNPLDLLQIWLNLPSHSKMADPAFVMLWDSVIPRYRTATTANAVAEVKVVAGPYHPQEEDGDPIVPPPATPDSWASNPDADVAIWQIGLAPGARLTLPAAAGASTRRTLYFYAGDAITIDGAVQPGNRLIEVEAQATLELLNSGASDAEILVLQGVPIAEPIVAQGPFVMNTREEIDQARRDFGRTQFGGWPWPEPGPVHEAGIGRFARHPGAAVLDLPTTV